jgi:integrase
MEWGKVAENPIKKVRLYREDSARTRFLTDDEGANLLACCGPQLKPLVVAAINTGFRASELPSLTRQDIDFRRGVISVRAGYVKNGEARSVPMNDTLTIVLKSAKVNDAKGERDFRNQRGQPYRSYRNAFERAVSQAGIQNFTFHDLRHTFASRLVMAGVDLATVKELMGHKHIAMTLRYAHLSSDHKQAAVKKLDKSPSNFHNTPMVVLQVGKVNA